MKIILSRKGFDSANGGIASPFFEDGTMVSFPIPCESDCDTYDDLRHDKVEYAKILADLGYQGRKQCHADPDLDQSRRKNKIDGWFPAFGQIDASASYLMNTVRVKEGDIFLFFGNFHCVEESMGKYRYVRGTGDFYRDCDLQVVWGYLQVGEVITDPDKQKEVFWHPHSMKARIENKTNVIFRASDQLSFCKDMPGAGVLSFHKKRVLTLEGAAKATWKKNELYDVDHIISVRKNSSKAEDGIYYAGIWQELGLKETDECIEWAKNIIL